MRTSPRQERTIGRDVGLRGVSFLSGLDVELTFRPAAAGTGIVFTRVDLPDRPTVPAGVEHVIVRQRRTTIQRGLAIVEMIEHVVAALAGLGIDNCLVEIDGPETPGCDGSSLAFVEALESAGLVEQEKTREVFTIDRPVAVRDGQASLTAYPGEGAGLILSYNLQYGPGAPIPSQSLFLELEPETFRRELAPCRTFLLEAEANALRQAGIGRRTTESDLIIFGSDGPIKNSLRFADEPVRHKLLDLVGDLALLGREIAGHIVAHRSGHALNAELVRALIASKEESARKVSTESVALDINAILELMPHRFPFLLVDRVVEIDGNKSLLALKNVTINEPFFQGHWPDRPIMPGVLILEAMAQAAGILISRSVNAQGKLAMIASIDHVKIRKPVVPGDQLLLEASTLRTKSRAAELRTVARVGGNVSAEATFRFVLVDRRAD